MRNKSEIKKVQLDLAFKGARDYAHGTDVYNLCSRKIGNLLGSDAWVSSIVFRKFTGNECWLSISPEDSHDREQLVAVLDVQIGAGTVGAVVVESSRPITRRYEYDEESIYATCDILQSRIVQTTRAGFTPIEEVVAITKLLHNHELPPKDGKWVFSELSLEKMFSDEPLPYGVVLKQNLAGRMTMSEILEHDKRIGTIKFTVAK